MEIFLEKFQEAQKTLKRCQEDKSRAHLEFAKAQAHFKNALEGYNYWNRKLFEASGKVQKIPLEGRKKKEGVKKDSDEKLLARLAGL